MTTADPLVAGPPAEAESADPVKRQQILAGARAVFLAKGYDGASMEGIAKAAGVSKGTLYVYFDSKEALFEALILEVRRGLPETLINFDPDGTDMPEMLTRLGRLYLEKIANPEHISMVRMVIGAAEKFPEFGQVFFRAGPTVGINRLAALLGQAMDAGKLRPADPFVAAQHFIDLCGSGLLRRMLFAVETAPPPARREEIVAQAVDVFLRAYGA